MTERVTVNRHIGGAFCVITLPKNDWQWDASYIVAGKDVREPDYTFIEYVRAGFVRHREKVHNSRAPERLIEITRNLLKGLRP